MGVPEASSARTGTNASTSDGGPTLLARGRPHADGPRRLTLLRLIERAQITRVGTKDLIRVNVPIHRHAAQTFSSASEQRTFRSDLQPVGEVVPPACRARSRRRSARYTPMLTRYVMQFSEVHNKQQPAHTPAAPGDGRPAPGICAAVPLRGSYGRTPKARAVADYYE